jgi:2-aminoadipate transaminase
MKRPPFDVLASLAKHAPAAFPAFGDLSPYTFVGGHNDTDLVPVEGLIEAATSVLQRHGRQLALYNLGMGPLGYPALREHIADKVRRHRQFITGPDEILVTHGSNQAIDFVCALFLDPGDGVLVEEFTYQGAITRFRKARADLIPMCLDEQGIDIVRLERQLRDLKIANRLPKLLYTIPTIQNPTGSILPLDRRKRLLALAREYGIAVIEDECYADLPWKDQEVPPALSALDGELVIHIGSFSKSLAPALRLGYMIASEGVLSRALSLKTDAGIGALDQMIAAEFFSGHFDRHTARLRTALERKSRIMLEALEREFGTTAECTVPKGGIFVWVKLAEPIDTGRLVDPAARHQVAFNPGRDWAVDPAKGASFLRLCFALPSEEAIADGVGRLADVCFASYGLPKRSGNLARGR